MTKLVVTDLSERVLAVIGKPFEWVNIPVGEVELEDTSEYFAPGTKGGRYIVPGFAIARYPITVSQYQVFIQAGGYKNRAFWTDMGWQWKTKKNVLLPGYWNDKQCDKPDHPVVAVSWFEAMAYCFWLSEQTGQSILVPTAQQWQRAAQGDDGREYPWGKEFDGTCCNHSIGSKSTTTTPVTCYENGASPYGVMDMSGNVNEWCLTEWAKDSNNIDTSNSRVLYGGSFTRNFTDVFRVAHRGDSIPSSRYDDFGFRCVCT